MCDDRMVQKQAELISRLNNEIRANRETIESLRRRIDQHEAAGKIWLELQKQIIETPLLQSEWERFLSFLKLSADEAYLKSNRAI